MDLHEFVTAADAAGYLIDRDREVDPYLEVARLAAEIDGRPMLFKRVKGSAFPVIAGVCSDRRYFGMALGVPAEQVMFRLAEALDAALTPSPSPNPGRGELASPQNWGAGGAPCQEVVEPDVNLEAIPFLTHYAGDAGAYASAAVAFINDPDTGPNASYHRLLRLDRTRVAARLVERRGTETAWRRSGPAGLPVAICIGLPPHVLLAASMAPPPGVDELTIAQALAATPLVDLRQRHPRARPRPSSCWRGASRTNWCPKGRSSTSPAPTTSCAGSR